MGGVALYSCVIPGSRSKVQGLGFRVQGPGFRVQGSGFRQAFFKNLRTDHLSK